MSVAEALKLSNTYGKFNYITKENLLNPSADFVCKFYSELLTDFNEKVSSVINAEITLDLNKNSDFPPEFNLYRETAKFYKPLNLPFKLYDILRPAPKRTTMFILHGIHFVSYVDNVLDSRITIVNDLYKRYDSAKNLQKEKQQLLNEMNECAQANALCDQDHKNLVKKAEIIDKEYNDMLAEKTEKDKSLMKAKSDLSVFKLQNEHYECKLESLKKEETKLRNEIVSDDKFETIKNIEICLKEEDEQLSKDCENLSEHIKNSNINLQQSENCLALLEALEFNSESLNKLIDYEKELVSIKDEGRLLAKNLNSLTLEVKTKEDNVQLLTSKIKLLHQEHNHVNKQLNIILNKLKSQNEMKLSKSQKNIEYRHRLENIIKDLEANKLKLLEDEKLIKGHFVNKYGLILNSLRKTVNSFYNFLLKQRDQFLKIPKN